MPIPKALHNFVRKKTTYGNQSFYYINGEESSLEHAVWNSSLEHGIYMSVIYFSISV